MTKTVTVSHTAALAPAVAVAALNEARLDACLQAPRQSMQPAGSWVPPWRGGSDPPSMITVVITANLLHCILETLGNHPETHWYRRFLLLRLILFIL